MFARHDKNARAQQAVKQKTGREVTGSHLINAVAASLRRGARSRLVYCTATERRGYNTFEIYEMVFWKLLFDGSERPREFRHKS